MKTSNVYTRFSLPADLQKHYQSCYPYTMARFLRRCMELAIKDKLFFEKVYFNDYNGVGNV